MAIGGSGASTQTAPVRPATVAHPWWVQTTLLVGLGMIILNNSALNVLLPLIIRELGVSQVGAQWVDSMYSLVLASLLITSGLMADKFGRRRLFLLGLVAFVTGSLALAMSRGAWSLIIAAGIGAVGAAMMWPSALGITNQLFTGHRRAIAFGMWGAVFGVAGALGPLLGCWVAELSSWRAAFLIVVPVAAATVVAVWRIVPESKEEVDQRLDLGGVILSAIGFFALVYGVIEGQRFGWWTALQSLSLGPFDLPAGGASVALLALLLGVAMLATLVLWELHRTRVGRPVLINLSLFRHRSYGCGNIVGLVASLGESGILFVIPLWIQSVVGFDPLQTAAITSFVALGALAAGAGSGAVSDLLSPTRMIRLGMVLEIVGIVGVGLMFSQTLSPWWLALPLVGYGAGMSFASAQLTNVTLVDVPGDNSAEASAVAKTVRQVGAAVGSAILAAVLFTGFAGILSNTLDHQSGLSGDQQRELVVAMQKTAGQDIVQLEKYPMDRGEVGDAKRAYTQAAKWTAYVAAILVFLGFLTTFSLPRPPVSVEAEATLGRAT